MGGLAVLADADDDSSQPFKFLEGLGKGRGLPGAARGVVLGIEVERHLFPQKVTETDFSSVLVPQLELGRLRAGL